MLIEQLEALIEKWENVPYTGDLTKAAKSVCASELREVISSSSGTVTWSHYESSNAAELQQGYFDIFEKTK